MTPLVLVVGDVVTDIVAVHAAGLAAGSDTPAAITIGGGGSGANTAAWLAALRVPVGFVGVVGTDGAGAARVAELAAAGVRAFVRATDAAPTGSVVVLSDGADRTMLSDRGANQQLTSADVDAALAVGARHLHLSGYTLLDERSRGAGRHALAAARGRGMTTSVDAGPVRAVEVLLPLVRGANLLLASADGAGDPAASAARLAEGCRDAVVTCGAAGAVWATSGATPVAVPAEETDVVDPTGAGDAFAAGLLSTWLAGGGPAEALRAGVAAGARAVRVVGGRPGPTRPRR